MDPVQSATQTFLNPQSLQTVLGATAVILGIVIVFLIRYILSLQNKIDISKEERLKDWQLRDTSSVQVLSTINNAIQDIPRILDILLKPKKDA